MAAVRNITRKRLRIEYSMSFSIMDNSSRRGPSPLPLSSRGRGGESSAFFQLGDDRLAVRALELAHHGVAGLELVEHCRVLDLERHGHRVHEAGEVFVVELDLALLLFHRHDLALDVVDRLL